MSCENCKKTDRDIGETAKVGRVMTDMMERYDRQNKRLWVVVILLSSFLLLSAGCLVFSVQNAQKMMNEAVLEALYAVSEIEAVTETTTVTQDTGEGGGNAIYQSGEYATYDEGGAK